MSLISRYILRAHIGPFLFGSSTVMFLFLLQFLMRFIDELVGKGLSFWVITQLVALNLAWMLVLAVPMGVLVSTLMSFGNLSGSYEVAAIKSAGGSLVSMMRPVIIASICVSAALFWFNDAVLPDANHYAKTLMSDIQRKKPTFAIEKGQFSTQIEGYSILARDLDSVRGTLLGVTIYDNTKANQLNVVSADSATIAFTPDFAKLVMLLFYGEIHQLNQRDYGNYRKIEFETHQIVMNASGFNFMKSDEKAMSRGDREMRIRDMRKISDNALSIVTTAQRSIAAKMGENLQFLFPSPEKSDSIHTKSKISDSLQKPISVYDAALRAQNRISVFLSSLDGDSFQIHDQTLIAGQYLVEIHKKYAIPLACLVFALVGCPLGIITKRGNFGLSAAISLGFYIVYWACLIGGEKLADRGIIEPCFGMWFANMLLGAVGIILSLRVSNESLALRLPFISKFRKK